MAVKGPSRRQARRDAAFVLYQHDVTRLPAADLLANLERDEGYVADAFTAESVQGVLADMPALDAVIAAHSRHWAVDRLAPLERNILRLALHEMRVGETPGEVAIDEAVRLAKRYSTSEAGALVNGILAAAWAEQKEGRQ